MRILARCTQKGDVRQWNNAKGSGKLFSFTVLDESCDLKVTAFKEDVDKYVISCHIGPLVDLQHKIIFRFEPIIKVGECYTISNGVLKNKNPQYNNTGSDYELTLGRSTVIELCDTDDG